MHTFRFFVFILLIFIISCKTIEKKVNSKIREDITEICFTSGFSPDIIVNGKLLLNFDQIDINLTYNDSSIFDASSDVSSDMISKKYIHSKNRLKELKEYEKYFSDNSELKLKDLLNMYEINLKKNENNSSEDIYKLDVKLIKYDPGEYNLIRNLSTKILVHVDLYKISNNIFSLKKIYEVKSDILHPTEKIRLDGIIKNLNSDVVSLMNSILSKKNNAK